MLNSINTKAGTNYLTEKEEKKLFSTLKNRKEKQAERDFVLLKLTRATALRRGEVLGLNVGDVKEKTRLKVDERIAEKKAIGSIYLPLDIQELIRKFLKLKRKWGESLDDDAPLFVSKKGNRLSMHAFNDLMTKWCSEAGIPRYTPHALRHTKAQRIMADLKYLSEEEMSKKLLFVKGQLRHKSLNSTAIYTMPTKEEMERVAGI